MRQKLTVLAPALLLFLLATAAWAAWLGWDQHRDQQPDGSTTGPYETWQVLGLALTVGAAVCWAAYRRHAHAAVFATTAGTTAAAFYDWSDDASGLFVIGVAMVAVGTLLATAALAALTPRKPPSP
ncbi:hypothetical protein [Streptomyces antimicrobicus]|uniref:Integral membrane protein n=1 Tax=Streptomyces antimicrobicus TaxID=2883108 RepID=A0ABS8B554_9ACTN|nr:hypothetical protein [Streptomyces antimicrobicus]MCB5179703.1 hypothetical protein [Streptomyces antimicrobicus]